MAYIILPSKWTQQPQYPVEIDWNNPFAENLIIAGTPASNRNIANGDLPVIESAISTSYDEGMAYASTSGGIGWAVAPSSEFTIISTGQYRTGNERVGGVFSSTANQSLYFSEFNSGLTLSLWKYDGGWQKLIETGILPIEGAPLTRAATSSSAGCAMYVNGSFDGSTTETINHAVINQAGLMYRQGTTPYPAVMKGRTGFLLFNKALSANGIQAISENPWQIFKRRSRRIWVAAAGGGTTLAITGQEVTAGLGTVLPDINYSIGGQSVTTSVGALVANLNVAITGQVLPVSLGSQVASISTGLAGQAVPLSLGTITVFSSGAVSLAITGQSTMISLGSFIPNTSYSLSGQNISASINNLTSDIMYTLSGQSTPIVLGTVAASVNSTLVGQPVSLTLGSTSASISTVLNGQSLVLAQSSLSPVITSSITGQSITASLGTVTPVGGTTPQYSKNSNLYYNIGNDLSIMLGSPTITTWNNSGRPTGVKVGTFGFNTETNKLEVYTGSGWIGVLLT